mmetsp:Transcript_148055/g.258772  ORF Transcript_148055/g.258772 Transcript_148055/m.258772 type:complete len:212 (+) Transcript_148055:1-636(+)
MCNLRFSSWICSRSMRMSPSRSRYWISPLFRVDCWMRIFSYSRASSSLRRMSCVPRMSRSFITWLSFFFCLARSASQSAMIWLSWLISWSRPWILRCWDSFWPFRYWISPFRVSTSFSVFFCAKCSSTRAFSLVAISSFSWSIWWFMILNFRFISLISSWASIRFFEYRFRSDRTASYRFCCCFSLASLSLICFCRSVMVMARIFTSSREE